MSSNSFSHLCHWSTNCLSRNSNIVWSNNSWHNLSGVRAYFIKFVCCRKPKLPSVCFVSQMQKHVFVYPIFAFCLSFGLIMSSFGTVWTIMSIMFDIMFELLCLFLPIVECYIVWVMNNWASVLITMFTFFIGKLSGFNKNALISIVSFLIKKNR